MSISVHYNIILISLVKGFLTLESISILIPFSKYVQIHCIDRECVRNLDLRVQKVKGLKISGCIYIVLKASKSAGAKGDVPKICGCVHPLRCTRANAFPAALFLDL